MAAPSFVRAGSLRRLLIFLLVPVVVQLHYSAWYGSRSVQYIYLLDLGWDGGSMGTTFAVVAAMAILGNLGAGVVGAALGSRITLVLGLALTGIGLFGLLVRGWRAARWNGVRTVLGPETARLRSLAQRRVLGLTIVKGTRWQSE